MTDMDAILAAQRAAFGRDGAPPLAARRAALDALQDLIRRHRTAIARAISADFGNRSLDETVLLEVVPLDARIRHTRRHLARWMRPERRPVAPTFLPGRARLRRQPLGVVGVIAPWNYPLFLTIGPLIDILAAGNRAMVKPSELTPRFSELLAALLARRFAPEQVAVVTGGPDVAQRFAALPFDHLLFTGSTAVGGRVAQQAAANLVPVTLELGGRSPAIVADDADLRRAARSIAIGKFLNAGQTCIAPDHAIVPRAQRDRFVALLVREVTRLYPRAGDNPDVTAVITAAHRQRLRDLVAEAEAGGARIVRPNEAATIVLDAPAGCRLLTEEIFGPVLPVLIHDGIDDAIARVGRPLALYLFTRSRRVREHVLARTISGGVTVNGTLLHIAQEALPFGGMHGCHGGREGFERFSHARGVYEMRTFNGFELFRPPYGKFARGAVNALLGKERGSAP
jgi:coniferyl-aldehyde dehydrogenase